MQRNLMFKAGLIVVTILVCIFGIIGFPRSGKQLSANIQKNIRLGLDLSGGSYLVLQVQVQDAAKTTADQAIESLKDAARTHGSGELTAWARGVLPVVSRPLVMAWLLTFCGVFLELPISQLLYAPGSPPASVAIQDNLGNYHFGVGMAQSVLAVAVAMLAVAAVLGGYRLLAPAGWRRIGGVRSG